MSWKITFDPAKRERTLRERGLDFLDAPLVFEGLKLEHPDDRARLWRGKDDHGWLPAPAHGHYWLDAARRCTTCLFDEEG